jgi:hypothetical protein
METKQVSTMNGEGQEKEAPKSLLTISRKISSIALFQYEVFSDHFLILV